VQVLQRHSDFDHVQAHPVLGDALELAHQREEVAALHTKMKRSTKLDQCSFSPQAKEWTTTPNGKEQC
jgi:hypothetical protein